ncbi:MAG: hypothetical protein ABIF10_07850, partial [Candidatus Woesearchaeota archaeon]
PVGYTEVFVAPELLDGKPPIPETDLYGAGMCMLYALGGDIFTKTLPDDVARPIREFCSSLLHDNPLQRPSWEKTNLVDRLADIRQQVFGRKHTDAYSKTRL